MIHMTKIIVLIVVDVVVQMKKTMKRINQKIIDLGGEASIVATSTPYLPTMHLEHDDSPASVVNCPCWHVVQSTAPALDTCPL